jgi:uncharacterized protein with GYD domain
MAKMGQYVGMRRARWGQPGVKNVPLQPHSGGNAMATYVTLYNFTDQALRNIKDSLKRAEAAKQAAAQAGLTVKEILWLQGQYDLLVISESSDEVTAAAFSLNILKQGNLRGQTLRAITAAEMETILEKVG